MINDTSLIFNNELNGYLAWLNARGISDGTQRAYASRVRQLLNYLAAAGKTADILKEERSFIQSVFDYSIFLKDGSKMQRGSTNNALTAADSFCKYLGFRSMNLRSLRESAPFLPGKSLTDEEQIALKDAIERRRSSRDRALAILFLYTGIRLGECYELNVEDVILGENTGHLVVRGKKKRLTRRLPLNEATRNALAAWLTKRSLIFPAINDNALFLNARGERLAPPGIDFIIRSIGWSARVNLSSQMLRRTFLVRQLSQGQPAHCLAQLAGHKTPQTTKRYFASTHS